MTILITGSTGTVGSQILERVAGQGTPVRALARDAAKLKAPAGVEPVQGDMADVASMRAALQGVPSSIQQTRVQIALQSDLVASRSPSIRGVDAPVDADDIVASLVGA